MALSSILVWIVAGIVALLVVERVVIRLVPLLERYLPDDICGPDGWYFDTARRTGIFDPRHRRD